jgi:hypothetical protein
MEADMKMSDEAPVFPIRLDRKRPFPESVDCGAPFTFTIAVETDSGCDLAGAPFCITDEADETVARGELPQIVRITPESEAYDPRHGPVDLRDSAEITVTAPAKIGSFSWTFILPEHVTGNIRHEAASLAIEFTTREHTASLAVWHNPTPVTVGSSFRFKAGAKCTAGCPLSGETIEVLDVDGAVVAQAVLGEAPWQGTSGLYWTTVEAPAPTALGHFRWSVRMAPPENGLPHGKPSPASFSFVTMNPPEHQIAIEIVEQETGAPVPSAQVRLGPHRAATNEAGSVRFQVPGGEFRMTIWKKNHKVPEQILQVDRDLALRIEAKVIPEEDPYSFYWKD